MRRFIRFAAAALSALIMIAQPARAAFPGNNGKIVYAKDSSIFSINADGTGRTHLTDPTNSYDWDPSWSPDGSMIAFVRSKSTGENLLVMDADGSNVSTTLAEADLPSAFGVIQKPAWSPDGITIAFCAVNQNTFKGKIFTVRVDGTGLTKLSGGADSDCSPAWSPDGSTIAVDSLDKNLYENIVLLSADGSTRVTLVSGGNTYSPNWAPSGAMLVFTKGGFFPGSGARTSDIYTVNVDGSGLTQVTNTPNRWEQEPAWSPDGTRITFWRSTVQVAYPFSDLWTIAPDGSVADRVTQTVQADELAPDWQPV